MKKAYLGFTEAYFKHLCSMIAFAKHSDGIRWYFSPDIVQPWIDDATVLYKELQEETVPADVVTSVWRRAHDPGFL